MHWKFWKKSQPTVIDPIKQAADKALAGLDAALPAAATEEEFLLAISLVVATWCTTGMDGQKFSREESLRRAGRLYHCVNDKIYIESRPDNGLIILGGDHLVV